MKSSDGAPFPTTTYRVTLVTLDADSGEIVGAPLTKGGVGLLVRDNDDIDDIPVCLLSITPDYTSGLGGATNVTFTRVDGAGDSITVPGTAVAYAPSPDGTLAYVVTDGTDDSTITVIDLVHGQIVATSSTVPGHAGPACTLTPVVNLYGQGGWSLATTARDT